MTLYSIIPLDRILEGYDKERPPTQEMEIQGVLMEVEPISAYEAKIVRLISPRAADFLNPKWMPGSVVRFHPEA